MKKYLLIFVFVAFSTTLFAQEEEKKKKKVKFDFTTSVHNQWYWRGYAVGPDPIIAAQASLKYGGLEIGTWNGYGFAGIWKDTDLYISYTTDFGLTIALWDIFNYSDYTVSDAYAGYGNHTQANYFDYGENTRHFFDLSGSYTIPNTDFNIFVATIIAGRDKNPDKTNRYSSYIKLSQGFETGNVKIKPYISYGFAFNSDNGGTFWQWTDEAVANAKSSGFNEVGVDVSKSVKITETYSINANVGVVVSPINQTIAGLLGITLF